MNTQNPLQIFSLTFVLLVIATLAASTLSGCGSSAAASKKHKSKKSIIKHEDDEREESEESEEYETEHASDSKSAADLHSVDKNSHKQSNEHSKSGHATAEKTKAPPPAETIWADLISGNRRFRAGKHSNGKFVAARQTLTKGEHPQTIVLGCADSRVPPEMVFDKNLGDLFVVRSAGNVADTVALGSIEYAIEHLNSPLLVVLGHESCGAVAAALSGEKMASKNLTAIVEKIAPAFAGSQSCRMKSKINFSCIELNVEQSAKDVLLNSPIIEKAVEEKRLTIIRAVYHLESGEVERLS